MKIKQEDFDKLPQRDRIEFLIRLKRIEERHEIGAGFYFVKVIFILIGFLILLSISSYNISEDLFISIFSLISKVCSIAIFGIIFCLGLDAISIYLYHKKIKGLTNKFFDSKNKK